MRSTTVVLWMGCCGCVLLVVSSLGLVAGGLDLDLCHSLDLPLFVADGCCGCSGAAVLCPGGARASGGP